MAREKRFGLPCHAKEMPNVELGKQVQAVATSVKKLPIGNFPTCFVS